MMLVGAIFKDEIFWAGFLIECVCVCVCAMLSTILPSTPIPLDLPPWGVNELQRKPGSD